MGRISCGRWSTMATAVLLVATGLAVTPGPVAARPVTPVRPSTTSTATAGPAPSVTTAAPPDLWLSGGATCDSAAGQWNVRWHAYLFATEVPVTITGASDPTNGAQLTPLRTVLAAHESTRLDGVLPGAATRADLELRVRVGEEAERTYLRTIALGEPCAVSEPTAECVNAADARYQHTFDGPAGTASVALVGPSLCSGQVQWIAIQIYYAPFGFSKLRRFDAWQVNSAVTRVVLVTDVEPCAVEMILTFGGSSAPNNVLGAPESPGDRSTGPLATYRGTGTCLLAYFYATNTCDGLVIQAINEATSALPAYFEIYTEEPIDQRQSWRIALAPGESRVVLVTPTAANPTILTNVYVERFPFGQRSWERPEECTVSRVAPPRRPAPVWTNEVPRRPALTRIGQIPRR